MKRLTTTFIGLLLAMVLSAQSPERISAEQVSTAMLGKTKQQLFLMMDGADHICTDSIYSDIFFVYSEREKRNIPIKFFYAQYLDDDEYRVYKVEFVSRKSKHYRTSDLRTAFWIEYIKNPRKK